MRSLEKNPSWVICHKETGKAVFETYDSKFLEKLNTRKYKAVPILEYLYELNRKIKQQESENGKANA